MPTRCFENKSTATMRMFCLPYAGGSAEFYLSWKNLIPNWIDLCPIQFAGRSYRLNEVSAKTFYDLVDELLPIISRYDDKEIILYGHSMGSVLAYEIAVRMKKHPILLCLTSGEAPDKWKGRDFFTYFSDNEMLDWMVSNYGYSSVDSGEIKNYLLPFVRPLRNDLLICESYETTGLTYQHPTIIAAAKDDLLCKSNIKLWNEYCPDSEIIYFENGGHFFNRIYTKELISFIVKKIEQAGYK
ncbi:thioesterase [Alphaproteobacteria bacterium]|nr:thioesterase [Alphaproteobacteria bacterium]